MVRNRKRKTDRGSLTEETMKEAVDLVLKDGLPIRVAADMKGVARNTLHTYVKKCKNNPDSNNVMMMPNYACRKNFTDQEEEIIGDYAIRCSQMNFGLNKFDFRKLVYEVALKNDEKIPDNWHRDKSAGSDWYQGFMKRNPSLSLRKPESCSLTRATSFNKHNVQVFFSKLKAVFERNPTFANRLRLYMSVQIR